MTFLHFRRFILLMLASMLALLAACASAPAGLASPVEIDTLQVTADITLRRLVVRNERARTTVLLLHGFPETVLAWKTIAEDLGRDHEVHAFDWPGYGLSSRPPVERFSYAPREYAGVLKAYIDAARIDRSRLVIYATDIGALPALLLALDDPAVARKIIVGDFAPFDRPEYMQDTLQSLKKPPSSDATRAAMNRNRDEILENAWRRGFAPHEQFDIAPEFKADMLRGWHQQGMSSADAFYHYYSHFDRDEHEFEAQLPRLRTPVKVVWGERDFYIDKRMGIEFASKAGVELSLLPGIGHYPHLQDPRQAAREIRGALLP